LAYKILKNWRKKQSSVNNGIDRFLNDTMRIINLMPKFDSKPADKVQSGHINTAAAVIRQLAAAGGAGL
jgi:uncharacterized membrane protein YebE (DUF533 family)